MGRKDKKMTEERCGNCRYFVGNSGTYECVEMCRRYPKFYYTTETEWCGEWTPDAMTAIERMGRDE